MDNSNGSRAAPCVSEQAGDEVRIGFWLLGLALMVNHVRVSDLVSVSSVSKGSRSLSERS